MSKSFLTRGKDYLLSRISAADSSAPAEPSERKALSMPEVTPKAEQRMLEIMERERVPGDVKAVLASAIHGDLRHQGILFEAMIDTWPRLQGNLDEMCGRVAANELQVLPYEVEGEEISESAADKAAFVKSALKGMVADSVKGRLDCSESLYDLASGYFLGHRVQEIGWSADSGKLMPTHTTSLPWRYYGYPYENGQMDRLMLNRSGDYQLDNLEDFTPHKFIVGIRKGHSGHAAQAAPLRALVTYWLGAVYGLKWLLNFAQIYGVPIRWATYSDNSAMHKVVNMLKSVGTAGYGAFPDGTDIKVIESSSSAQNLPQQALIDNADKACDIFILGQTLTTDTSGSGSRALGEVHADVKLDVIDRVGTFVAKTLRGSIVKYLLELNYGDASEMPTIKLLSARSKDEKGLAERDKILAEAFPDLDWSEEQIRERHSIAKPLSDEDTLSPKQATPQEPHGVQGDPATGPLSPHETKAHLVAARRSGALSVDALSDSVLRGLTGVSVEWLTPVKPFFQRLAALAMSETVSDADFIEALTKAQSELPELFDVLDTEALETAFTEAIGTGLAGGSADRYTS